MQKLIIPPAYPYLYETHLHTSGGSACGSCTPLEAARAYLQAGYSGVFITEHNWGGNTAVPAFLPWPLWVGEFVCGYYEAKTWGDANGLAVFWGYEAGFDGTEFLVLGLEPDFLFDHPEIRHTSIAEHYRIVKAAGGFVVHAHPFREAPYIPELRLLPEYVDAVEGINATHHNRFMQDAYGYFRGNRLANLKAIDYAGQYDLPLTAGSDMHNTRLYNAGMAFAEKPADDHALIEQIKSREGYLLTDGLMWYDAAGRAHGRVEYE